MKLDFASIEGGLKKLQKADPNLSRFGAQAHKYQLNPIASGESVEEVERTFGIALPEDFRTFLLTVGDGGAGPYYGLYGVKDLTRMAKPRSAVLPKVFPLTKAWRYDFKTGSVPEYDALVEDYECGRIAIGAQGDGFTTELIVSGGQRGQIWADLTCSDEGLHPLANSFTDWYMSWLHGSLKA